MNTVIIKNVTDEEDETQAIDPQYAGKSYDELLLALLEERTKEEKIPAEIVYKELLSNLP
jgi:hypothetical protein